MDTGETQLSGLSHTADITGLSGRITAYERDASDCSTLADADQCCGENTSCDQIQDDSDYIDDLHDVDFRVIDEYRKIVKHFNELPKDMFVAQLVRDYNSSETDLEHVRDMYFEHLKNTSDNFLYGPSAILKRRMFTRSGEPVWVRLAQDIYCIVDVAEGGDPSLLSTMISHSSRRSKRSPRTPGPGYRRRTKTTAERDTSDHCTCTNEVKLLKDTVASLQADVLNVKQMLLASEKLRTEQTKTIMKTFHDVRSDIYDVDKYFKTVQASITRAMCSTDDMIKPLETAYAQFDARLCSVEYFLNDTDVLAVSKIHERFYQPSSESPSSETHYGTEQIYQQRSASPSETHYGTDVTSPHDVNIAQNDQLPTSPTPLNGPNTPTDSPSTGPHSFQCEGTTAGQPIPVIISSRADPKHSNDDGFHTPLRRRTKHYFVGGYTTSVSLQEVVDMVNSHGPSVTNIRMFPVRNSVDKVVLRLNVEADSNADNVMQKGFCPPDITCRPWLSRGARRKQRDNWRPREATRARNLPPWLQRTTQLDSVRSNDTTRTQPNNSDWHDRYFSSNRFVCINDDTEQVHPVDNRY